MNQYGIRIRKKVWARMTKEHRKQAWEWLRLAVQNLRQSKGSQRVHTENHVR